MYRWREYWAGLARSYAWRDPKGYSAVLHAGAPEWFNALMDRLQARAWRRGLGQCKRAEGCLVLDVGCGTGRWLRRLAQQRFRPVGADATLEMLRRAAELDASCFMVAAEAQKLPFRDCKFDMVSSVAVVQHIPPPYQDIAIMEMARVLRPGGYLILFELIGGHGPELFSRPPEAWIQQVSSEGLSLVCWFGQEYLLLDRWLVGVVQTLRGLRNGSGVVSLAGMGKKDASAKARIARQLYWNIRRILLALSSWMEPFVARLCPRGWAMHGVFVFRK